MNTPQEIPQWAKEAAREFIGEPSKDCPDDALWKECDVDDLAAVIARHAPQASSPLVGEAGLREALEKIARLYSEWVPNDNEAEFLNSQVAKASRIAKELLSPPAAPVEARPKTPGESNK